MNLLLDLTLRGSMAALIVIVFDRSLAGIMIGPSRRWLWCFVPLAFLVPLRMPILPAPGHLPAAATAWDQALMEFPARVAVTAKTGAGIGLLAMGLWLAGAMAYLALVTIQTTRASRRWSRERLSTDHALLELLEQCKAETGVTAPIGLVVSSSVPSAAIMGWVRPRILIPTSLAAAATPAEIRPILLHELAHFRWYDVPFNWLLTVVRAIHWFNPMAHLAAMAWARFREEAADEAAIKWMREDSGQVYGEALVRTLRQSREGVVPFGSLAIVESVEHLKRRIAMINRYPNKAPRILLAGVVSLVLTVGVFSKMAHAADSTSSSAEADITASAQAWLAEFDGGHYEQCWKDASSFAQTRLSMEKWVESANRGKNCFGKCAQRQEVSLAFKKDPIFNGVLFKGEFAFVKFKSSFENKKQAVENVNFYKEADGTWKVADYHIRP